VTHTPKDTAGQEYNTWWKLQQAKTAAPSQIPAEQPASVPQMANKPDNQAPAPRQVKPQSPTLEECTNCPVRPACKLVLKLWHKREPRPVLARGWCVFIDENRKDIPCLREDGQI